MNGDGGRDLRGSLVAKLMYRNIPGWVCGGLSYPKRRCGWVRPAL